MGDGGYGNAWVGLSLSDLFVRRGHQFSPGLPSPADRGWSLGRSSNYVGNRIVNSVLSQMGGPDSLYGRSFEVSNGLYLDSLTAATISDAIRLRGDIRIVRPVEIQAVFTARIALRLNSGSIAASDPVTEVSEESMLGRIADVFTGGRFRT